MNSYLAKVGSSLVSPSPNCLFAVNWAGSNAVRRRQSVALQQSSCGCHTPTAFMSTDNGLSAAAATHPLPCKSAAKLASSCLTSSSEKVENWKTKENQSTINLPWWWWWWADCALVDLLLQLRSFVEHLIIRNNTKRRFKLPSFRLQLSSQEMSLRLN